jgi:hypothetical protein
MGFGTETQFEGRNLIDEGSQTLVPKKRRRTFDGKCFVTIAETHRMRPLATIIRGQNLSVISQKTWESCDCGGVMKSDDRQRLSVFSILKGNRQNFSSIVVDFRSEIMKSARLDEKRATVEDS